jgi:hypothetical protein
LREIGATQNSTVVFPIDLVKPVLEAMQSAGASSQAPATPAPAQENGALEPGESRALESGSPGTASAPSSESAPLRREQ